MRKEDEEQLIHSLGSLSPLDTIYNALCGNGDEDVPICAKYVVLAAIHDHYCGQEAIHLSEGMDLQGEVWRLIDAVSRTRPKELQLILDKWWNEVKNDIESHTV